MRSPIFYIAMLTTNSQLEQFAFARLVAGNIVLQEDGFGRAFLSIISHRDIIAHFNFFGLSSRFKTPILASKLPKDKWVAKDFSWISEGAVAPEKFTINRWDVESMTVNPETGLTENRTANIGFNVGFTKDGEGNLEMTSGTFKVEGINAFGGDIWALILKTAEGEFCDLSLKPNFVGLDTLLINYFSSVKLNFQPYLWKSDEYSVLPNNSLIPLLEQPEKYEAQ